MCSIRRIFEDYVIHVLYTYVNGTECVKGMEDIASYFCKLSINTLN